MKHVYVVTRGWYSDYSIHGIFSKREKAEEYLSYIGPDPNDDDDPRRFGVFKIEEWVLDPFLQDIRSGKSVYHVRMDRDGNLRALSRDLAPDTYDVQSCYQIDGQCNYNPENREFYGDVMAKSENAAIKIMNERRTQMIATGILQQEE